MSRPMPRLIMAPTARTKVSPAQLAARAGPPAVVAEQPARRSSAASTGASLATTSRPIDGAPERHLLARDDLRCGISEHDSRMSLQPGRRFHKDMDDLT